MNHTEDIKRHKYISYFIFCSGLAALSWEVVWQIKSSLALGVSSMGTAMTLAVTMGGMALGALVLGELLKRRKEVRPIRLYGILELIVGFAGLSLVTTFQMIESFDTWAYQNISQDSSAVFLGGITLILGIPAFCLGATLPVIGLISQQNNMNLSALYGLNTLGAAMGCLVAAFFFIPTFGVETTIFIIAAVNIMIGIAAFITDTGPVRVLQKTETSTTEKETLIPFPIAVALVCLTGFATFVLEVAWFRSLTAAFMSTTDAFAIMLASVLVALGIGARIIPLLKMKNISLSSIIACSGILVLLITPVVERFDFLVSVTHEQPTMLLIYWFVASLYVIGPPILLLGVALPWILDQQKSPQRWGVLYGLNALFAIIGAICAAWVFLPTIGFARISWLIGGLLIIAGITLIQNKKRLVLLGTGFAAMCVAVFFESGVGRDRVQGHFLLEELGEKPKQILAFREGVDATISVVEYEDDVRLLVIDGFETTSQGQNKSYHYMQWMGHLPMLAHPSPKQALVICFGTGQTARAVVDENPERLDIVDLNKDVYDMAHHFPANKNVLDDTRVNPIVMDGRSYIRRTTQNYDVITLEPMPPNFAGVNALYSKEFYEEARHKLTKDGVIAQWVPFHLLSIDASKAIVKTFQSVYPNSILWIDPASLTGILLGSNNDSMDLNTTYPGYERLSIERSLTKQELIDAILLDKELLKSYAGSAKIIDDNNQLLAYGKMLHQFHRRTNLGIENHDYLDALLEKKNTKKD